MTLLSQAQTTIGQMLHAAFATDLRYPILAIAVGTIGALYAVSIGERREQQRLDQAAAAERANQRMRRTVLTVIRPQANPATIARDEQSTLAYEPGYRASET